MASNLSPTVAETGSKKRKFGTFARVDAEGESCASLAALERASKCSATWTLAFRREVLGRMPLHVAKDHLYPFLFGVCPENGLKLGFNPHLPGLSIPHCSCKSYYDEYTPCAARAHHVFSAVTQELKMVQSNVQQRASSSSFETISLGTLLINEVDRLKRVNAKERGGPLFRGSIVDIYARRLERAKTEELQRISRTRACTLFPLNSRQCGLPQALCPLAYIAGGLDMIKTNRYLYRVGDSIPGNQSVKSFRHLLPKLRAHYDATVAILRAARLKHNAAAMAKAQESV